MEYVSLRLDPAVLKQVQKAMKQFNYSTKTEFFREAVRDKLNELNEEHEKRKAWNALFAARGVFKGKGKAKTDEEFRKLREKAGEEFIERMEKKFNQK